MLSLKRHMMVDELLDTVLNCYRSTLRAIGKSCAQAVPLIGQELQQTLLGIETGRMSDTASVERASAEAQAGIASWSARAAEYYRAQTDELKQIMVVVARAAGCIGERDQRYAKQIHELSARLLDATHFENLADIRQCLTENANALNTTVDAMIQASQDSVAGLRAEVVRYESLLRESERLVLQDPLTGLKNRRGIEEELQRRTEAQSQFSVLILDLDKFKEVNDTLGHVAGDDLLKQFADELKSHCNGGDALGRLGGDEFIVITNQRLNEAERYLSRLRSWIFGNYKINDGQRCRTAYLTGSAGVATWDSGESIPALLSRADQAMYRDKGVRRPPQPRLAPFPAGG